LIMDRSNMKQVLRDYPKQFPRGLEAAEGVSVRGSFDRLIVSGMGGSALPADMLRLYLEGELPVMVNRDYVLPALLARDLVFFSSYSGGTEETLAAYGDGMIHGASMAGFSAGGTLEEWCSRDGVPHVKYPNDGPKFQPRCATGYAFSAMVKVLSNSGAIRPKDPEVAAVGEYLQGMNPEKRARELAGRLGDRIPVVYSSERMGALARMWTIKFQENSKVMARWNVFPELNHNEMVGYESSLKPYCFIILRDPEDHERVHKRMDITARLIEEHGGRYAVLDMGGQSLLSRLFGTAYMGDWVSYYLALERGADPTPVDTVQSFKKRLLE
jgi:glucose/mannose-6-phosphate isomerase